MQVQNASETLIDTACQIQFLELQPTNAKLQQLQELVCETLTQTADVSVNEKRTLVRSVEIIQCRVEQSKGWFSWLRGVFSFKQNRTDREDIDFFSQTNIALQKFSEQRVQADEDPLSEADARLKFFSEEARKLGIREAAQNDLQAIKTCSKTFWDCSNSYQEYAKHMKAYFCGEHFLVADDGALNQDLAGLGIGHLRSSSHYDFGSTDHQKGGAVPENEDQAKEYGVYPQYEITGPQVKVLLFSKVCLNAFEGMNDHEKTCTFSKETNGKVRVIPPNVINTDSTKKTFSWLQAEWAPDSANWREANFWKHRVFSFGLYVIRKLLKLEKPNVGPYGYGHGDLNAGGVGPTILYPKKNTTSPTQIFQDPIIADESED